MWETITYVSIIRPTIEQHLQSDSRKQRFYKRIEEEWGGQWRSQFDPQRLLLPSYLSEHLLASMRRMSIIKGVSPKETGRIIEYIIKQRLLNRGAGRRAVTTITAGDCLQGEQYISKRLATSPTKKRRIDLDTDIAIPLSKRPRISNTSSNTSYNANSSQTDEETHNSTDNDSDWETSQGSKPRTIIKPTNKSATKKQAGIIVDESDTEVRDPKLKINFRDCPCKISTAVKNKLVLCRKRAKNDS